MQEVILTIKDIEVSTPGGSPLTIPRGALLIFDLGEGIATYHGLCFSLQPDEYLWPEGGPSNRHAYH